MAKRKKTRKQYTLEQKQEAVRKYVKFKETLTAAMAAQELGLAYGTLRAWEGLYAGSPKLRVAPPNTNGDRVKVLTPQGFTFDLSAEQARRFLQELG